MVDENLIRENLTELTSLLDRPTLEERAGPMSLPFKEIRVSRLDPEKDGHPCDPGDLVTKMRTAWYRVDLRMSYDSLNIRGMLGKV